MKQPLAALVVCLLCLAPLGAQTEILIDEEALFGGEEDTVEAAPPPTAGSAIESFLKTEAVRIGGSFSGSAESTWTMRDPWSSPSLDEYGLEPLASGTLFFDARPEEDFRVYGKVKTSYPFATSVGGVDVPAIEVFELFADWNYKDALFLRFGKHTVKWGVGYFFSPADVINLGAIDLEDPTAQREGPLSLRLHYPVLGSQTNLWVYAILPAEEDPKPEDLAGAAKLEFLLARSWEIGLGAYYRYDRAPRAVLTASGSYWKLNLFGEAVGSWGSDKDFVTDFVNAAPSEELEDYFTSASYHDRLFFSGTAGFTYSSSESNTSLAMQYMYNGEGYSAAQRDDLIDKAEAVFGEIGPGNSFVYRIAVLNSGRHYAAASFSKTELFAEDLSFSLLGFANLSDLSGFLTPTLSWELFDRTSLSLSASFVFGAAETEYVILNDGPALSLGLKASLGAGSF